MSDHYQEGEALDRTGLFQLVTDEAFRDGVIDPRENEILQVLARFLRLESSVAKEVARLSKAKFKAGELGAARPLDPEILYGRVLDVVASDGEVDDLEEQMLLGLRQLLEIDIMVHDALLADRLALAQAPPVAPPPPDPSETPAVPVATKIEATDAFRYRVGAGRVAAQQQEDERWARIASEARPGVRQVWAQFLVALPPGPVPALDAALRTLEQGVEHANCLPTDAAAILRLAQASRILRRTDFMIGASLWYGGDGRYAAVMRTLTNVLLDLHARPVGPAISEALDLTLVGLWRDLVYATARREAEVLQHLVGPLALACQVGAGMEASRLGEEVLPVAMASLQEFDEGCLISLERLQQKILQLAPQKTASPSDLGPLRADLEVLARETRWMGPAAQAAAQLDSAPFEAVFASCRESVEEQGAPWDSFRSGFFSAAVLPDVDGLAVPVVVLVSAGDGPDARQQLKRFSIEFQSQRTDSGHLLLAIDLGPRATTRMLMPPIAETTADAFQSALVRSEGRYLVLVVDQALRPLRVYEQAGDLEVSGAWGEAWNLLGEDDAGADRVFEKLLDTCPWLAAGHIHRGLIAKRAGDIAGARRHFETACEVRPDYPVALTRLGVLAKQAMEPERAIELLERSLAIEPTQPDAAGTLASIYAGMALSETPSEGMEGWIRVTAGMHALSASGPDLEGLTAGLRAAGLPEDLFRHLGRLAVDPALYG